MIYAITLIVVTLLQLSKADYNVTWQLSNYNNWQLPFAKNVEILNSNGSLVGQLPERKYLLLVDPTAFFSVIFAPSMFIDTDCSDCVSLNFTIYGRTNDELI